MSGDFGTEKKQIISAERINKVNLGLKDFIPLLPSQVANKSKPIKFSRMLQHRRGGSFGIGINNQKVRTFFIINTLFFLAAILALSIFVLRGKWDERGSFMLNV